MEMENQELNALISLLDDPDGEIFDHVSGKLLTFGTGIIPTLENVWEVSIDPILQGRIENLIQRIHFDGLVSQFQDWIKNNPEDLFEGAFLVAKYQYPELDKESIKNKLDVLKRSIWLELNYNLTPLEQVNIFNHVFYSINEFSGKSSIQPNPEHLLINKILETKRGNSISLGILYMILAKGLDMPVFGVNLSKHFVLAYTKSDISFSINHEDNRDKVLFYINPLNRGTIFSRNEIVSYLKKFDEEVEMSNFVPCSNVVIIKLLLEDLRMIYDDEEMTGKFDDINKLLALF